jgi:hypothetical protein
MPKALQQPVELFITVYLCNLERFILCAQIGQMPFLGVDRLDEVKGIFDLLRADWDWKAVKRQGLQAADEDKPFELKVTRKQLDSIDEFISLMLKSTTITQFVGEALANVKTNLKAKKVLES